MDARQQQLQNAQAKASIQFASIQAADSHIKAMADARAADTADAVAQEQLQEHHLQTAAFAKFYGIEPTTISWNTSNELHTNAIGAMRDSAAPYGGKIPRVSTTNSPDGQDADAPHEINVYYAPTPAQLQSNPNSNLQIVNDDRAVQGLPPLDPQQWRTANGSVAPASPADMGKVIGDVSKWQADRVSDAQAHLLEVPQLSKEKDPKQAAAQDAATLSTLNAQLVDCNG